MERLLRHDGESRDTDRPTWSHIDDFLEDRVSGAIRNPKGLRRSIGL